jgi:hypothetical protein
MSQEPRKVLGRSFSLEDVLSIHTSAVMASEEVERRL